TKSFRTISRQRFRGPVAIGAWSTRQWKGLCPWTKWKKNTSARFSRRQVGTSTKLLTRLVSTVKRCIVILLKSKRSHRSESDSLLLIVQPGLSTPTSTARRTEDHFEHIF